MTQDCLIVLENQEEKKNNRALRGIFCTLPFLKAFAQAKECINAVFVLKWRPLETSREMKEGGVLQRSRKMSTTLVDRLKRLDFKGLSL